MKNVILFKNMQSTNSKDNSFFPPSKLKICSIEMKRWIQDNFILYFLPLTSKLLKLWHILFKPTQQSNILEHLIDWPFVLPSCALLDWLFEQLIALNVCFWFESWVSPVNIAYFGKNNKWAWRLEICHWEKSKSF